MGYPGFLYPFYGKKVTLTQVMRYYKEKGIPIDKGQLGIIIKIVSDKIGRENITEEMFLDMIKLVVSKRTLSTVDKNFKINCINEFGQQFWDDLLERKKQIRNERNFRRSMRIDKTVNIEKNSEVDKIIVSKKENKKNEERM